MVHKFRIQTGFETFLIVFTLIYNGFFLQAQEQLDQKFKENANKWYYMEYQVPKDYHGIVVEHCFSPNEDFIQSALHHSIKCKKHNIVVAFALITAKPDNTPRGIRIREALGDPARINLEAIANEADTILSKTKYLDTLQLKKVNANRGVIYNMRMNNKYIGTYARCKKVEIYKDNVGRAEILFFYNKGDDALVDEEIENTWGMLKFK
jgi:hypothetical protein